MRFFSTMIACVGLLAPSLSYAAQEDIVVVGQPLVAQTLPATQTRKRFSAEEIALSPYDRLDLFLTAQSGFSLFRRIDSNAANPTIQGATLRGIGPNGAGRANVLLDGVPVNDPFGNWVNWAALPPQIISGVSLEHGGQQVAGGSGALSGQIALSANQLSAGTLLGLSLGSLGSFDGVLRHGADFGDTEVLAYAAGGVRDGYILLPESQRGPADVSTANFNGVAGIKASTSIGDADVTTSIRAFAEGRDNGIAGARNTTDGLDLSVGVQFGDTPAGRQIDIVGYGQVRQFENLFTATDATRTTSRPVLDQFSVPAHAAGLRLQIRQPWAGGHTTRVFAQLDHKSGKTQENFRNLGAGFTRERVAGGKQLLYGLGLDHEIALSPTTTFDVGARIDGWTLHNGSRTERDITNGATLRADVFARRSDILPGGHVGVSWQPSAAWRGRMRAYTGYRLPSLNEYFRPFRVGNDITEANPMLDPEKLYGIDIGTRFEPLTGQSLDITVFANWVKDAVGNVTIAGAGGVVAPCGFVPANGSCRQRSNIDRLRVLGLELRGEARLSSAITITSFYSFTAATVRADDAASALIDNRLAQVPRHRGNLSLNYQPPQHPIGLSANLRFASAQFEDDLNSRKLEGYAALDISARWQARPSMTFILDGNNVTDSNIVAGLSANGLETLAAPASVLLRAQFSL